MRRRPAGYGWTAIPCAGLAFSIERFEARALPGKRAAAKLSFVGARDRLIGGTPRADHRWRLPLATQQAQQRVLGVANENRFQPSTRHDGIQDRWWTLLLQHPLMPPDWPLRARNVLTAQMPGWAARGLRGQTSTSMRLADPRTITTPRSSPLTGAPPEPLLSSGVGSTCGQVHSWLRAGSTSSSAPNPASGPSVRNISIVRSGSMWAWLRKASTLRPVSSSTIAL